MEYKQQVEKLLQMPDNLCSRCGKCCQVSFFPGGYTHEELLELHNTSHNVEFITKIADYLSLFDPISFEEAYSISPCFVEAVLKRHPTKHEIGFFSCKFFDNSDNSCFIYEERPDYCKKYPIPHSSTIYHQGCSYEELGKTNWKKVEEILNTLNIESQRIEKEKKTVYDTAKAEYDAYSHTSQQKPKFKELPQKYCNACGKCCDCAVSFLSYSNLIELSNSGNTEAVEFLSIFKPYESNDIVEKKEPKYYKLIKNKLSYRFKEATFYYCQYLGDDGLCTIYENRPRLCRETPYSPWMIMPEGCGFTEWLFVKREQLKKYVRKLKEVIYWLENTPKDIFYFEKSTLELFHHLNYEDIDFWTNEFFEKLINTITKDVKEDKSLTREEFKELIQSKIDVWADSCIG